MVMVVHGDECMVVVMMVIGKLQLLTFSFILEICQTPENEAKEVR